MNEAKVQAEYDRLARIYDLRWRNYITDTLTFLYNWEQIDSQALVLDVGCGTGEFERLLLHQNPTQKIAGVDLSAKMLNLAREKYQHYPNVELHQASVNSLPFADRSFDVVVSASAFHYFEQPQLALLEIKRVLKPDGKLIILDWNKDYLTCKICDWLLQIFDPAHQQCYTQKELHQLLVSAGFKVCRATKVRFGIIWGLMAFTTIPYLK
jgi:ubiquinone/menaquinone biosynthesis C-methylase UbiE